MGTPTKETGVVEMNQISGPDFKTWERQNLENLATDMYYRLQELADANEQLRLDLKAAMQELRKYQDDWK